MSQFKCPSCGARATYNTRARGMYCLNGHYFEPPVVVDRQDGRRNEEKTKECLQSIEMTDGEKRQYGHLVRVRS